MGKILVGVTIDKIQKYLYDTLNSKIQESQNDEGTLQAIIRASNFISTDFSQEIANEFPVDQGNQSLIACSGKYIFITTVAETIVKKKLNALFQKYYLETDGQLFIKFVCLPYNQQENKLTSIQSVTTALKKSRCLNQVIEENQEVLFQFPKNKVEKNTSFKNQEDYPSFVKNINALASEEETINQNHFRIAVIKADFDGMGALLSNLHSYDVYKEISDLLTKFISIDTLHDYTKKISQNVKEAIEAGKTNYAESDSIPPFEIYPFYVAGDDIFFAVRIEHLLSGVEICKQLLQELNRKISLIKTKESSIIPKLSLSVAIELSFNREPIRYYHERVSKRLDDSVKKAVVYHKINQDESGKQLRRKNAGEIATLKVGMNETVFLEVLSDDKEERTKVQETNPSLPNWFFFTQDMDRLNRTMKTMNDYEKDTYAGNRFFYTLLEKLTDEQMKKNPQAYQNSILYHLLPRTWEIADDESKEKEIQQAEFELFVPLIEKISQEREKEKIKDLVFKNEQLQALEACVRFMLLFSDPRFKILTINKTEKKELKKLKEKGVTILINRSMRYLYDQLLPIREDNSLREIFVKQEPYTFKDKKNKIQTEEVFRTLTIGTSMFHRLKSFKKVDKEGKKQEGYTEKIITMIQSTNTETFEEIKNLEEEQKKKQEQQRMNKKDKEKKQGSLTPPKLFFDQSELRKKLDTNEWNEDYIDSLLIFYKLKQLLITFKTQIKK